MRHFLAYGNSDQSSFRDPLVRESFDYMTVPGTIAAYYPDATAAFVLSSELNYIVDPRTPLFQGLIRQPRASHLTLASILSPQVAEFLVNASDQSAFTADLYSPDVIDELVTRTLAFQREYGGKAGPIQTKLERYQRLLAEARGEFPIYSNIQEGQPPAFVLAPYFLSGVDDEWDLVMRRIWARCASDVAHNQVCAVVAAVSVEVLDTKLQAVPRELSTTTFFWVNAFDERKVRESDLRALWEVVLLRSGGRQLVNMYGGFFSICLQYAGLWGFNNGLGYSEFRDWPELPATGAAPARYYVPRLHVYASQTSAQLLIDRAPSFRCSCEVCRDKPVVELSYLDLKRHFALTRRDELRIVQENEPRGVAQLLDSALSDFTLAAEELPRGFGISVGHLARWSSVLNRQK
jgi:hypothetical protein